MTFSGFRENLNGLSTGILVEWYDGFSKFPQQHKPLHLITMEYFGLHSILINYYGLLSTTIDCCKLLWITIDYHKFLNIIMNSYELFRTR